MHPVQYYRPIPLLIPIRWNFLFLLINGSMVVLLMKERREARDMGETEQKLFDEEFSKMGFTDVEFYRLISAAKKTTVQPGFCFCSKNADQEKMYFIVDGDVSIKASTVDSPTIAVVRKNSFIGEMSFLSYLHDETIGHQAGAYAVARAPCNVLEWDFDELRNTLLLEQNRGVCNAFQAFLSCDLRRKLSTISKQSSEKKGSPTAKVDSSKALRSRPTRVRFVRGGNSLTMNDTDAGK